MTNNDIREAVYIGRQPGFILPEHGDLFQIKFEIYENGQILRKKDSVVLRLTLVSWGFKVPHNLNKGDVVRYE